MRKHFWVVILFLLFLFIFLGSGLYLNFNKYAVISPLGHIDIKPKPLLAYTFENLRFTAFPQTQIVLDKILEEDDDSISQVFYFSVPEKPKSSVSKKVSGVANLPKKSGKYPVIVMFRGFADKETYRPGLGTQPAALAFAKRGFITLAPDFLGYGESASPSADPFEERFQTYTTALTLLASLPTLNQGLTASFSGSIRADSSRAGIWGHSNGGHIALAVLAISGASYPTVLWAPVSKSFPYSILYYTDEFDDQGKLLRKKLADFENDYDTGLFSPANYFHLIKAPLEIDQGTEDEEVPVWWSNELVSDLTKFNLDIIYTKLPGADHNLLPDGWSQAVSENIIFFRDHLR